MSREFITHTYIYIDGKEMAEFVAERMQVSGKAIGDPLPMYKEECAKLSPKAVIVLKSIWKRFYWKKGR